ncbi:hypothetical protein FACS189421_10440 [Bacteroidia bacterium]|nr:hypothetical protein FACS189421_10440 [Bacteroidia bacterium]GHT02343.1 hypothetical protein FACS189423_00870 [Bacteroidia bacterium]GHT49168.1 hypothetical protein FACS189440_14370 [Bacteroidia bacterium]
MKTNKSILLIFVIAFLNVNMHIFAQNSSFFNIGDKFFPYGYMGCTEKISVNPAYSIEPYSAPMCFKIEFTSSCNNNNGWAGVYWTNEENNWGERQGTDFSNRGFTKITFWAKGNDGGETIEFGSGGIDKTSDSQTFQYKDSYKKYWITEKLTNQWKLYSINLSGVDLSSVIGGFYWAAKWQANPNGVIFYLDNIQFE